MTGNQNLLFPEIETARYGSGRRRQHLILEKFLTTESRDKRLHDAAQGKAHAIFIKWADLESGSRLRKMNESQIRAEFLTDVFGQALGYSLFSENRPQWELQAEFVVPGGLADAAIGQFSNGQGAAPRVLIELKGPTVNVDRDRFNGRTPVQQLWDYLYAVPSCPWGIVTNCVSFRLYHREKTPYAYELFVLNDLRAIEEFRRFWVLFERGGLLPTVLGQRPRADQLLEQSDRRQLEVGAELYRDYHTNRLNLIEHLQKKPHSKTLDRAIHITQKLLDRIIFVAFCEDRDLLPIDAIGRAWNQVPPYSNVTNPRWQNFKELFRSIDAGNPKASITPYNGGLFKTDDEVDELELEDRWTEFFRDVSRYDFREEVNVDVLGHLFEQSVTDLETLRLGPDARQMRPSKKTLGRRKREGIFYTPLLITRYIVENAIGPCLQERFDTLARRFGVHPQTEPTKGELTRWTDYQMARLDVLRRFRVCDPACGSGAFLIQAYDYLLDRYEEVISRLDAHANVDERTLRDEIPDTILRENLFGVDLSPEAVEISQLALWIRTARIGRSLADLSRNVQCGNSIVDDAEVDARAFDWTAGFPQVFQGGKFDCVISNPPYVKLQNFRKREPRIAEYLVRRFRSAQTGNFDMYVPFIERGLELLNPDGRMGFIAPSLWLYNEYGRGLRELVAERKALARFVDFKSFQVFPDATTYTALQFFRGSPCETIQVADARSGELPNLEFQDVSWAGRGAGAWALLGESQQRILNTMRSAGVTLGDASEQIFQGLITSADAVYHLVKLGPGRYYSKALEGEVEMDDEIMKPLVSGGDAVPFATPITDKYLLFPYYVARAECRLYTTKEMGKQYKRCWAYLRRNEITLRAREGDKMDHDAWYAYVYPKNLDKHERPKLLVPRLLLRLFAGADAKGQVYLDNVDVGGVLVRKPWNLFYILGILNSKACNFVWRLTAKPFRGEYRSANKQFIAPLPIPKTKTQKPLAGLARRLAHLHGECLRIHSRVRRRFATDLTPVELVPTTPLPPALPTFLQTFDDQPAGAVIRALEKYAKRRFKPVERAHWDEYLTEQVGALGRIKREIADHESELNTVVYRLFGLNADQIAYIESHA